MEAPPASQAVARSLEPFFANTNYYYPFGSPEKVQAYGTYILGNDGVGGGSLPHFSELRLLLNGSVVLGNESGN
jgi:hypothetical protein